MTRTKTELAKAFKIDDCPRSAMYDPQWVIENMMGPNVLWLTESLSQVMDLRPGMRVLDIGCGRAISSIFLAKEFGLQVWAVDRSASHTENWTRVCDAGLEAQVFPVRADARTLPFADGFFDAVLSMDAYHYWGADDLYLAWNLIRLVKPDGEVGIVVPGLREEFEADPPPHLRPYWEKDRAFWSFHSAAWWSRHWERSGVVSVETADMIPGGWKYWLKSNEISAEWEGQESEEAEMLRTDGGRNLGFTRMVAVARAKALT